jgi:hypothetical protein
VISWDLPRADTVRVTKRTIHLAFAAALGALVLSGCGGSPDDQGLAAAAPQPAYEVVETPAPADSAVADQPAADQPTTPAAAPDETVKKIVTETQPIGFATRTVQDGTLAKGKKVTRTTGRAGVRTRTYEVTLTGGKQTAKKLVKSVITRKPVTQVVAVGTKTAPSGGCDPNYSGACVPIASDVDCAGGSGNGPAYVRGPVRVVGTDIYDLDRDGDGVACD